MVTAPDFYDIVKATEEDPRSGEGDMVVLRDGRIMFAYTSFRQGRDDARADIVARVSSDRGRTWTEPELLVSGDEALENVMSVSFLRPRSGGVLLFYLRKDSRSRCRALVRRSDDEAATWSEPVGCTPGERYHVIVNNCAVQLSAGRLVLPYEVCAEVWTANERILAAAAVSDDEGQTWGRSNEIYAPKRGAMEARLVERRDGTLWMLMRTDQGSIWQSTSTDRGMTWCEPTDTGIESPQSPFVLTRIPSTGALLLVRNPIADLSQGSHQGHRTPLVACISWDDGVTWENEKLLEADTSRTYCYLSTTFVDDLVLFSYYVGRPEAPLECLRIARVPVEWFCQ